jgi:photosystem II CP47 chlorophyll apoprotein
MNSGDGIAVGWLVTHLQRSRWSRIIRTSYANFLRNFPCSITDKDGVVRADVSVKRNLNTVLNSRCFSYSTVGNLTVYLSQTQLQLKYARKAQLGEIFEFDRSTF